jgi:hypothetical protein
MNYMNYGKSRDLSVIWEFRKIISVVTRPWGYI